MTILLCEGRWQFAYWVMGRHFEDPPLYSVYTKDNAVLLIYMDRGINPGGWGVATPRFWAGWTCWPGSTTPQISNQIDAAVYGDDVVLLEYIHGRWRYCSADRI